MVILVLGGGLSLMLYTHGAWWWYAPLAAAERLGPSGAMHGIEPSTEMAAHARHKAETHRVPLEVIAGSADSLPYPPTSFDAVFCTLVLHHLPQSMQEGAIREMRRVLVRSRRCGRRRGEGGLRREGNRSIHTGRRRRVQRPRNKASLVHQQEQAEASP